MDLLNGDPVCVLKGDEFMPIEGKPFKVQINEFFQKQGGKADSPFGVVILDMKGIKNDISHGIGRLKSASFAAIKDVLEKGVVINPMAQYHTNGKKNPTGMIAAPIQIGDEKFVCVVEVIANTEIQRLYVHEVTLTKNLQRAVADSTAVHRDDAPVTQPKGEITNVLHNYLINQHKEEENNKEIKTESRLMKNKKQIVRLTESDLHKIIKEAINEYKNKDTKRFNTDPNNRYGGDESLDKMDKRMALRKNDGSYHYINQDVAQRLVDNGRYNQMFDEPEDIEDIEDFWPEHNDNERWVKDHYPYTDLRHVSYLPTQGGEGVRGANPLDESIRRAIRRLLR